MKSVLVLNFDYVPINITTWNKGFTLVYKGKAELIKVDEQKITSSESKYDKPLIIRLLRYIKHNKKTLKVNRNRIYRRDNFQCVYCNSKKDLTIDHIIPKSRGGGNDWYNLVTSCSKCNNKKADRTPDEANMRLLKQPYAPLIVNDNKFLQNIWEEYQSELMNV